MVKIKLDEELILSVADSLILEDLLEEDDIDYDMDDIKN